MIMKKSYHFKNYTPEEWSEHQKKTHSTKEFKEKQSMSIKKIWTDPKVRKRMLKGNLKANDSRSANMTKQWTDPVLRKKRLEGIRRARSNMRTGQNRSEAKLEKILIECGYRYIYTGSSRGIEYSIGPFYPDFVHCREKRIIELFSNFWHTDEAAKERDSRKLKCFKLYGYKVLIIWDYELKDVDAIKKLKKRIARFHRRK